MNPLEISNNINCNYYCNDCSFTTNKLYDYNKHLSTSKHLYNLKKPKLQCICKQQYKTNSGLQKHKKVCNEVTKMYKENNHMDSSNNIIFGLLNEITITNKAQIEIESQKLEIESKKLEIEKQNLEKQDIIIELLKEQKLTTANIITNSNNINSNNINSNNQKLTVNMFLNQYCNDAVNFDDFMNTIKPNYDEIMEMTRLGNRDGLFYIINKALSTMKMTERPIHCTDIKRHTTYIKNPTGWDKEQNQEALVKLCNKTEQSCLRETMRIIDSDPIYKKNGTNEYELAINMMRATVGHIDKNRIAVMKQIEERMYMGKDEIEKGVKMQLI